MPAPQLRLVGRAQRPSATELAGNPRARSALLRVAERTAAPFDATTLPRLEAAWRG
jgi:16S rRNA (cytosine1402-N4)-methyltransferase